LAHYLLIKKKIYSKNQYKTLLKDGLSAIKTSRLLRFIGPSDKRMEIFP